jgi:hypothetical protein
VMVRKHTQATAKLLYTATALPALWSGTTAMLPTWLSGGRIAVQSSQCHRILSSVMNVARPIGDGLLFIGDAANLKAKLAYPKASAGQIARAALDVGLDATRLITYALPQTGVVKAAGSIALWARTGLGVYDVVQHRQS